MRGSSSFFAFLQFSLDSIPVIFSPQRLDTSVYVRLRARFCKYTPRDVGQSRSVYAERVLFQVSICHVCRLCRQSVRTPLRPRVAFPRSLEFWARV